VGNIEVVSDQDEVGVHAWRLTVSGEVDASTVDGFDGAVDDIIDRGGRFVVLDFSDVQFLDSSGLRGVVRARNLLEEHDGRLTVAGLSGAAQRVLELTGLLEHLRESTSEPAADG